MDTLGEALPREQARVRGLITIYRSLGPIGEPTALMMEHSLQQADKAVMNGDVVEMMRVYEDLKGYAE